MQQTGRKYGKVKVKRTSASMDEVPEDCGYMQQFKFNVDMNSNGVMAECIEWCQLNCEGKWGWWFEQTDLYDPLRHNWEEQNSYMSFEDKREATAFFLAIGIANMGNRDR